MMMHDHKEQQQPPQQQTYEEYELNNSDHVENENEMLIPTGGADPDLSAKKRSTTTTTSTTTDNMDQSVGKSSSTNEKKRHARSSKRGGGKAAFDTIIKYVALILLVGQMVGLVLLMRYSRTVPRAPDVPLYLASTAVFVMEFMKLMICLLVILIQVGLSNFFHEIKFHIFQSPMEIAKLCIPSLLYTVQNNLLYLALSNLDAATYQVCYQLKILTTAVFSAILLQRKFSSLKWLSLVILTIGVAIVEISGSGDQHTNSSSSTSGQHHDPANTGEASVVAAAALVSEAQAAKNHYIGIVAVICAACTSGFSGVYFEKILKGSNTSLWIRNVQMGLPSIIIAYVTVYFKDSVEVNKQGFLGGYTWIVWTVVIVQAVGGLIVATVVKYADNVLKVFATSFSIVISCIISSIMFNFRPNTTFIMGATLVVIATVLYSSPEKKERRKTLLPLTSKTKK
jgi:solute carrier family 35 (UDP-sugar transporter), member A1/2/3